MDDLLRAFTPFLFLAGFMLSILMVLWLKFTIDIWTKDWSRNGKWHKHHWVENAVEDSTGRLPSNTIRECEMCGEKWIFKREPSLFEKGGTGVEHLDSWWKLTGKNSLQG